MDTARYNIENGNPLPCLKYEPHGRPDWFGAQEDKKEMDDKLRSLLQKYGGDITVVERMMASNEFSTDKHLPMSQFLFIKLQLFLATVVAKDDPVWDAQITVSIVNCMHYITNLLATHQLSVVMAYDKRHRELTEDMWKNQNPPITACWEWDMAKFMELAQLESMKKNTQHVQQQGHCQQRVARQAQTTTQTIVRFGRAQLFFAWSFHNVARAIGVRVSQV